MKSFTISSKEDRSAKLWESIEKHRAMTREQFRQAVQVARESDRHIGEVLYEFAGPAGDSVLVALAHYHGIPSVILRKRIIASYVLNLLPKEVAEQHSVVIFKKIGGTIHVATTNPENTQTIEFIQKKTGLVPKVYLTSPADISHALKR
ncbi:MAG: hypothetical protein V1916_03135, partial [Patescibacteria group bacterium]